MQGVRGLANEGAPSDPLDIELHEFKTRTFWDLALVEAELQADHLIGRIERASRSAAEFAVWLVLAIGARDELDTGDRAVAAAMIGRLKRR